MAIDRYARSTPVMKGRGLSISRAGVIIRKLINSRSLPYRAEVLKNGQRLDQIAFREYGDGRLWWVIAAASGIGWAMQLPPGTYLLIPTTLDPIEELIG